METNRKTCYLQRLDLRADISSQCPFLKVNNLGAWDDTGSYHRHKGISTMVGYIGAFIDYEYLCEQDDGKKCHLYGKPYWKKDEEPK